LWVLVHHDCVLIEEEVRAWPTQAAREHEGTEHTKEQCMGQILLKAFRREPPCRRLGPGLLCLHNRGPEGSASSATLPVVLGFNSHGKQTQ
jgi:hypothetical protein